MMYLLVTIKYCTVIVMKKMSYTRLCFKECDEGPAWILDTIDGDFFCAECVTANSRLYAQLGIRPSIVVKFHYIPTSGVGENVFTKISDGRVYGRTHRLTDARKHTRKNKHFAGWSWYKKNINYQYNSIFQQSSV